MLKVDEMFKNESAEDIVKMLATLKNAPGFPQMDRLFSRHKWPNTSSYELILTYQRLLDTGVIQTDTSLGRMRKGPNWTEPPFMTDKRYG